MSVQTIDLDMDAKTVDSAAILSLVQTILCIEYTFAHRRTHLLLLQEFKKKTFLILLSKEIFFLG